LQNKRKICVVTGTRAEYGLLSGLMDSISKEDSMQLQIIATGTHLEPEFGSTYKQIEADGFYIDKKVEMSLSSDTPKGIVKSMGIEFVGIADAYDELNPDLIIVLGDRYEIFVAVSVAMMLRLPVAHLHGGEATFGAIDESIRHSITKMSHVHFTSTDEYRDRVVQLGENPINIYNVGAIGIDNINNMELLSKQQLEDDLSFKFGAKNILVTFHPATLEATSSKTQFRQVLNALDELEDTQIIFTKANADADGRVINHMIDDYVANNQQKTIGFTSMGQLRYLSALKYVDMVLGNSSSGIIEAPYFKIGTVNVGARQDGRIKPESVIDCQTDKESVASAIQSVYSNEFQEKLKTMDSPYGDGEAAKMIMEVLKTVKLDNIVYKKFYDTKETT